MTDSNLPIPVYLNQQIVFDLFAVKDDGFSMIRSIKESDSTQNTEDKSLTGGLGVTNLVSFFGIRFDAKKEHTATGSAGTETEHEKIHTPNSLFAKLRKLLVEDGAIANLDNDDDFSSLKVGQFVEFDATLSRPPLIELLNSALALMKSSSLFDQSQNSTSKSAGKSSQRGKSTSSDSDVDQLEGILQGVSPINSIQLLCKITTVSNLRAVISTKPDFFIDSDITEALDGEFRILGKITRVVTSGDKPINLLERTSFSLFKAEAFDKFFPMPLNHEMRQLLNLPTVESQVSSPAIQLIPVAIFR